ncbi:MAG: hypothetical protein LBR11_12320 [Deltaproteobacteria bacterium]|jgi:hypothetical protein|nr:hypothetical protein [Deltaproteobacteria bacterium]
MRLFIGALDPYGRPIWGTGETLEGKGKMDLLLELINPPFFSMNRERDPDKYMAQTLAQINPALTPLGESLDERVTTFFEVLVNHQLAKFLEAGESRPEPESLEKCAA